MCERLDSIRAVSDAADELLKACCQRRTFRGTVNESATAPLPADFSDMLGKLGKHDGYRFADLRSDPVSIQAVHPVVVAIGKRRRTRD